MLYDYNNMVKISTHRRIDKKCIERYYRCGYKYKNINLFTLKA